MQLGKLMCDDLLEVVEKLNLMCEALLHLFNSCRRRYKLAIISSDKIILLPARKLNLEPYSQKCIYKHFINTLYLFKQPCIYSKQPVFIQAATTLKYTNEHPSVNSHASSFLFPFIRNNFSFLTTIQRKENITSEALYLIKE